jgi:hypothetical protein
MAVDRFMPIIVAQPKFDWRGAHIPGIRRGAHRGLEPSLRDRAGAHVLHYRRRYSDVVGVRISCVVASLAIALTACGRETPGSTSATESTSVAVTPGSPTVELTVDQSGCASLSDRASGATLVETCDPGGWTPTFAWGDYRGSPSIELYRLPEGATLDAVDPASTTYQYDASGWLALESTANTELILRQAGDQFRCPVHSGIVLCRPLDASAPVGIFTAMLTLDRELVNVDASILETVLTGGFSNRGIRADVEVDGSTVLIVAEKVSEADGTRALEASAADLELPFAITIVDSTFEFLPN